MTDDLAQSQQKLMVEFISVCEQWYKLNNGTVRLRNNAVPWAPYVNYRMLLLTWKKDCLLEKSRCRGGTFHRVSVVEQLNVCLFVWFYFLDTTTVHHRLVVGCCGRRGDDVKWEMEWNTMPLNCDLFVLMCSEYSALRYKSS